MLIQELKEAIMKDELFFKFGNKLIFVGEESYLQNLYIKQLAKKTKSKIFFADDYLEIKKSISNNTMMNNKGIYVIRNNNSFLKDENLIKNVSVAVGKYLILIYDKIDKRKQFYKSNLDKICEFEKMTKTQLIKIAKKELPDLINDMYDSFIDLVGNDYGRLLLEIDKLQTYFKINNDKSNKENFVDAFLDGLIYKEISDDTFQLVNAIMEKNPVTSFKYLNELKRADNDAFKLIGLLYNNYKNLLLYKDSNSNLSGYLKGILSKFNNKYTVNDIIIILDTIREVEQGIKTGKIDAEMALDILVIKTLL